LLGWIFLQDKSWRTLLFIICLPGIYALIEHMLYGRESLRYLWVQHRYDEVCALVDTMCELNERAPVSHDYVIGLMEQDRGHK
jgi:hypothetical protein